MYTLHIIRIALSPPPDPNGQKRRCTRCTYTQTHKMRRSCARGYIKRENWCYNVERNTQQSLNRPAAAAAGPFHHELLQLQHEEDVESIGSAPNRLQNTVRSIYIYIVYTCTATEVTTRRAVMSSLTPLVQWFSSPRHRRYCRRTIPQCTVSIHLYAHAHTLMCIRVRVYTGTRVRQIVIL